MSATIMGRMPEVTVEYDTRQGRKSKHFKDAYAARRFYSAKAREGRSPSLRAGNGTAPRQKCAVVLTDGTSRDTASKSKAQPAIYVRVSTKTQDVASQLPDLQRWAANHDGACRWFTDKASGKSMSRPAWSKLETLIRTGRVSQVVVWRLDRLGRTASGLTALFDELQRLDVNLVSIRDGLNLSTSAGRLMANVLASVAQVETEIRAERVLAGQAAARAAGKRWGGSLPGVRKKVTPVQEEMVRHMKEQGATLVSICAAVALSRPTVNSILRS